MRSNVTGAGFYNSEPRNFNRGFGRGYSKPYQSSQPPPSPQPPPRRGDLFIEAGQLAVEYLVSHGLLSSNVLPGKLQNGSLKSDCGEQQDQRSSQDRELPNSHEAWSNASARPRAASPDGVSSSRRSPNDQDLSRKYSRERRKYGDSRSFSSDWSRENGRGASLPEKETPSQAIDIDYEKHPKDNSKDESPDACVAASESAYKDGSLVDSHHESGAHSPLDSGSKIASLLQCKDDGEPARSDGVNKDTEDDAGSQDKEQEVQKDESFNQQSEDSKDTVTHEKMVSTEVHSSSISKSLSGEPVLSSVDKIINEIGHGPLDHAKDVSESVSSDMPSSNEMPSLNCVQSAFPDHSFSGAGALDSASNPSAIGNSFSLAERSTGLQFHELRMNSSVLKDRGEKRAHEEDCITDEQKKAKLWLSVAQSHEYLQLANLIDKKPISPQRRSTTTFSESNKVCLRSMSLPQRHSAEPTVSHGEEMQLFSSSFKTCDLNLMEASDMNENHGAASLLYPSVKAPKKEAHIDVDLSMSNNFSFTNEYIDGGSVRKDVEIIDLEGSSLEEGKCLNTSTKNAEAVITSMESLTNNLQNPNDNPEGQDGYGFMISELLGNDVPNCSSVQPDMTSLHNDMGLHHGEGIFNEDDPIYMSLGEIPLSLLRGWEQPTQEKNPFEL